MAEPVITSLSEMIDMAIGTPEVGVVDFGMIQTVLHILAHQLGVLGKNVELRGAAGTIPVGKPTDNSQTVAVTEFIVDTEAPGGYELATSPPGPDQDTLLVVERMRKSEYVTPMGQGQIGGGPTARAAKVGGAQAGGPEARGQHDSAHTPQSGHPPAPQQHDAHHGPPSAPPPGAPHSATDIQHTGAASGHGPARTSSKQAVPHTTPGAGPERLSLVTISKFNVLENTVEELKNRVYGTSPKNEEILQEVRSQGNLKAITDMWNNMNVASRLDACEEGIGKLSSLVEDLIGETAELQEAAGIHSSSSDTRMAQVQQVQGESDQPHGPPQVPGGKSAQAGQLAQGAQPPKGAQPTKGGQPDKGGQPAKGRQATHVAGHPVPASGMTPEVAQLLQHVQKLRNDVDILTETFYSAMKEVNEDFTPPAALPPPSKITSSDVGEGVSPMTGTLPPIGEPPATQYQPLQVTSEYITPPQIAQMPQIGPEILSRINNLEKELKKCCDSIHKSDGLVNDQLASFQDQLEYMSKQIAGVSDNTGVGQLSPDLLKDLQGLMQLFQTVQDMQSQLAQVHATALSLAAEKEDRQNHIDALLEQIELLKTIKLDREDMVEALADKADLRMLARKVSHDQFETACDDLSKGLEHALGKLNVQEALWQQALDDIQREIETKLDKMELSPVKEFFNNKLKQLQDNLKQMAALRREAEAAGTKKRLLRDVNCISCDAKAVMPMEAPSPLPAKPLPATLSMKPYLSYELDAIRKVQASSLPQRNMHDWEHIDKQMMPRQPYKVRSETDKHLCNRYCGGSHTVTTPAQRVARLGHFIKQWGPEVLPLSSGFAAGDDGRLYKISTTEGANVGPGGAVEGPSTSVPKSSPVKKPETKGPKPIECRCLDPTDRPSKH
ncbi:hypothetical protein HW555_010073 [Spodoptera exigua]|uniref:DUF4795 domain-containing protein n=1 Tax=Spodoptera exigua TaxID=7107 RepID=A0A835GA44_SPOEX|nr:hypothetical protein HW555_010073 [Spodoptera exigua]